MSDPAERESILAALVEQGATPAEAAPILGVRERQARTLLREAGAPPAPRGRPPTHERPVPPIVLRLTREQYRAVEDYAIRHECEIADAILENVMGQCRRCSEPAILDAREEILCERCTERDEEADGRGTMEGR